MPISRRVFDNPENAFEQLILEFLRINADLGFTIDEIIAELKEEGFVAEDEDTLKVLTKLVNRRRVEAKLVFNMIYYSYESRIGFRPL